MAHITIVGLGPGAITDLTLAAWQALEEAGEVWLRTSHHPVVRDLPAGTHLHTFDAVYERAETFDQVYVEIASEIVTLGRREQGVVYAVPGHPLVGESTVTRILSAAEREDVPVKVIGGLSFVEPALTALRLDGLDGLQIFDALDLVGHYHPPLNPDFPALIAQVYSRAVASELKLVLMNQYEDQHPVALLDATGTGRETVQHLQLFEMDRSEMTALTTLYVAPVGAGVTSFEGFQETVARLRSPEGCPWDREQTHQSLRTNLLEECYEVLEAMDAEEPEALREELGDLLLQVVLHAQIATEEGEFYMTEVIEQIDQKLKRRHPHVWGETDVAGVGDVITNWEVIKRRERVEKGAAERSLLDGIPTVLPALAQAAAYADRAGRIGFDEIAANGIWVDLPEALGDRLADLLALLDGTAEASDAPGGSQMLGDMLLVIADWARRRSIDPESVLREANQRFAERFRLVEAASRHESDTLKKMSPDQIRRLWKDHI